VARVLVVEDEADTREALRRALAAAGHAVDTVEHGSAGLSALLAEPFDVVILDLRMPIMDGVELLKVIRSYTRWRDTAVVIVTAVSDDNELSRVAPYNVSRIFLKANYHLSDLVDYVNALKPA
jgi:DNA-binding response OmpR family regulator